MDKVKEFEKIVTEMASLYAAKNTNYGDSFGTLYKNLGPISGLVPLHNKLSRATELIKGSKNNFESLEDTFKDLACYAIMNLIEFKSTSENDKKTVAKETVEKSKMTNWSINNVEVYGINAAMRGMRNPKNSWDLNDTVGERIGPNDMKLAKQLIIGGAEHRKFLRQIKVWFDLDMPRFIWSEYDTYHFNTKNSCSTMHKLFTAGKPITKEMFFYCKEDEDKVETVIRGLNDLRKIYVKKDTPENIKQSILLRGKSLLPEGFMQLRTIATNYEELLNIYFQRKSHRLPQWREFAQWLLDNLPYFRDFVEAKQNVKSNQE